MSVIDSKIDEILESYHLKNEIHTLDATDAIITLLNEFNIQWRMCTSSWCNCEGETVFIAWIEDNNLYTVCYDVIFNPEV